MRLARLFLSNRLREWRDEQFSNAALVLHQLAADLAEQADSQIDGLSRSELAFHQMKFLSRTLGPMVRSAAQPVMLRLVESANRNLEEIAARNAVWGEAQTDDSGSDAVFDGWRDVVLAAAPITGGIATAAALPVMAVTTTVSWFGLITTTAISWPVVVGGSALAGGLLAAGVWNTSQLADRLRRRLRSKAREQIRATLIAGKKSPAVLEQFAALLNDTIKLAKQAS